VKAFLLAAGVGNRLRPITATKPKCMVPIKGRPLLDRWLDAFAAAGVDEVLVNLHHLSAMVAGHIESREGPPVVRLAYEPELLGSAGTLLANRQWVDGEEFFLVCNADNLTDFDLRLLVGVHQAESADATLTVFFTDRPSEVGVIEVNQDGWMVGFEEKPRHPVSCLANAGMYAFDSAVLDDLDGMPPLDIGYDLLPRLTRRARVLLVTGFFQDIGTVDSYRRAEREWREKVGS
jgi:mannose-1-phosphate guanylyltransferase